MSDTILCNRKFTTVNLIDDCSREALAIEIYTSLSSKRIIRTLDRVIEHRGKPSFLRADNGPEFISKDLELWAKDRCITLQYIQLGKPMQNGYIERFNRVYREAVLDAYLFSHLYQVKQLTEEWMEEYNQRRPHEALQNLSQIDWSSKTLKEEFTKQKLSA